MGGPSSGGFDFGDSFDSVFVFDSVAVFRQLVLTWQSSPGPGRGHHQFEHHETRGVLRQRALHADGAMLHRREHRIGLRSSQVVPASGEGRKNGQQRLTILDQARRLLVVFWRVSAKIVIAASAAPRFGEIARFAQISARWLHRLRACRARSMSCAASIADDASSGMPRRGPSRTRARHRHGCLRRDDQAAPSNRRAVPSSCSLSRMPV